MYMDLIIMSVHGDDTTATGCVCDAELPADEQLCADIYVLKSMY